MNIPNVKITIWFACSEDAREFATKHAIARWKMQPAGQRVYVEPPPLISEEDWTEFGRFIGVDGHDI